MWKDSIRNIVVIFQTTILRIVGFYVRHSATDLSLVSCLIDTRENMENMEKLFTLKITYSWCFFLLANSKLHSRYRLLISCLFILSIKPIRNVPKSRLGWNLILLLIHLLELSMENLLHHLSHGKYIYAREVLQVSLG